jgi:hypothetical protein
MLIIYWRLRQEDCKFEASLGYTVKPHLERKEIPTLTNFCSG